MTFHYFAYGSNMLPARLTNRCQSATLIGTGIAANFRLGFSKASKDGSGKATLVAAPGARVYGAIFEINDSERAVLDAHEGLGHGYRRDDDFVVKGIVPGSTFLTNTYLATSLDAQLRPFDWYLAIVIAGATYHQMEEEYLVALRSTAFIEDPVMSRESRVVAMKAMQDHGIDDYRTLLENPR
jgi:hypothetical protein